MARANQTKKDKGVKKAKSGLPSGGLMSIVQSQIDNSASSPLAKKKSSSSPAPLLKKKSSSKATPLLKKKSSVTSSKSASPAALSKKASALTKKASTTSADDPTMAQVDSHVPHKELYEVVYDPVNKISHSVYLMKTEIKANNNKFYVVQVLKKKGSELYGCFTRYGRVGQNGVAGFEGNGLTLSLDIARANFFKKVKSKKAGSKGYTEIKMACGKKDNAAGGKVGQDKAKFEKVKQNKNKSKLDEHVQSLINFIFDKDLMTKSVVAVGYDVNKMPLGELSKSTVMHGYRVLRQIEDTLSGKTKGDLAALSGEFYTHIPHNFGF